MTWLLAFQIYLISCIPALIFFLLTLGEDIQCRMGWKKPDSKFGYNWVWPFVNHPVPLCFISQLVPVLNLVTGWYLMFGMLATAIGDWFRK